MRHGDDGADDGREAEIRFSKPLEGYFGLNVDEGLEYDGEFCRNSEV